MKLLLIISLTLSIFIFTSPALANLGVGIGLGKIIVDDTLYPGDRYVLPEFPISNTGDEASFYSVAISHRENQLELRPSADWFSYEPKEFFLKPGETQLVKITLNLPLKLEPGDYFAFVTGQPTNPLQEGTSIGIAAASKFYFKVGPATLIASVYYKSISLWKEFMPWSLAISLGLAGALIWIIIDLNFDFKVMKKPKSSRQ